MAGELGELLVIDGAAGGVESLGTSAKLRTPTLLATATEAV